MLHPFQTDTFDPGSPDLLKVIYQGRKLHEGFRIGATAFEVDGARWILLHQPYPHPNRYPMPAGFFHSLAYPMPEVYGDDPFKAMKAFEDHWNAERRRLWELEPMPEPPPLPPSAPAAAPNRSQPRRPPKGRPVALAGAVPLPGLEPWTAFGRRC